MPKTMAQVNPSGSVSLHAKRDVPVFIGAAIWTGVNYTVQFKSPAQPKNYTNYQFPLLDNFNRKQLNPHIAKVSDATAILTGVAGAATLLLQPKSEWVKKGAVMGQSLWISVNLAHSVKMLTHRARPYTNAPGFVSGSRDDYYSFFSGHSVAVSSIATSAFLMRNRQSGSLSSPGQIAIPVTCAALAATTAVLRILAGKHYPSDVLTGIVTGMGIAYINYRIHEK